MSDLENFLARFSEASAGNCLVKLTLSVKRDKNSELKNVFVKPVLLNRVHVGILFTAIPPKTLLKTMMSSKPGL